MKLKLIILTMALFSLSKLNAQTSFSCTYRQYCDWDSINEKYVNCQGYEESSLFVVNKTETMFTHTTETMKSSYYVDSKQYDEQNDVYTYFVTSDVGNKYYYIFDPKNKEVRAVFKKDGKTYLLKFTVKAVF